MGAGSLHDVVAAVEAVREDGFINYFGLQRFGSTGGRTHRCRSPFVRGFGFEGLLIVQVNPEFLIYLKIP